MNKPVITTSGWNKHTEIPPWDPSDSSKSIPVICYSHGPGYIVGVYHRKNGWMYSNDEQWPIFPVCWHLPLPIPKWAEEQAEWLGI